MHSISTIIHQKSLPTQLLVTLLPLALPFPLNGLVLSLSVISVDGYSAIQKALPNDFVHNAQKFGLPGLRKYSKPNTSMICWYNFLLIRVTESSYIFRYSWEASPATLLSIMRITSSIRDTGRILLRWSPSLRLTQIPRQVMLSCILLQTARGMRKRCSRSVPRSFNSRLIICCTSVTQPRRILVWCCRLFTSGSLRAMPCCHFFIFFWKPGSILVWIRLCMLYSSLAYSENRPPWW